MDLPYTMWTYFGNIARYEGTEVNVFAPDDGVRAVAPTYNPETGEIGFAQNDDGSLRQSVTVKEIESANTLVIFGIDPSSGEITIQDGVQLNLGMNKALSMANPAPAPAPEVQAPAAQAPAEQTPAEQTTPEDGEQLSLLDAAPTRDIGFAPETDTDGRKVTVVPDDDHEQTTNKPDLSVTPPEETEPVVFPSVAQENVAAAPPDSPLFQQLRGIVASMLYDVPEAAPAIAETMGLSPEGLQILRDNDNVTNWAELTAAGLSDADRAALQHAAALKLVSTLDPDQPASLFLSWFDWHIGTQADFTITQPHLQNAINMDNAGMDEVAAVMGVANFKRLVLSTHGLPGGQIMKTEEGSGFNVYDARIMAEIAERAGVSSVLLAHCYGALGADGVNTLDVDSRQASGSSIAEFSSRGMDVSAYEGAVNTRTATQMVGVWSELIAAGLPDEAALQLAGAFANATGGENLNSINWSQYVSHARAELGPEGDPQAWANRNGFVDTQIRGRRVGPEQILQLLIQYGDVLLATQGVQDAPKAWQGKIPENQVDLLARMTVNDLIHGGLYPQAGITGADAQMIVRLLEEAWRGAPLVQNGELPDWAVLGSRLYFALEGQVAAIQHMDPAERAQRANVLQNLQIMRDEVWIRLAAAGQGIIDDQGQLAFLPPTDLTHYATSDANLAQSAAPAEVDGVPVADVTQTPGDVVSVDPNAPVQALLFDLDEVGAATTRSLPTPGLVGGVTTPAAPAPQGDDSQLRQDVLVEARAYFKPMLGALLTRAATRGSGGRQDRALNGLTSAVSAQLDTFRRALTMKGLDAAWVTTDVVLDMLARDTELARALQEATPGLGIEPGQLLAVMDPAHRLATQLKAVPGDDAVADDTRLGLLRDTLHRTDGAALLTGLRGGELIAELARIKDPQKRALATEMLRSGQALALGDQNGAPRVERVTRALDGSTTREAAALATELSVLATTLDTKNPGSKENNERLAHTRARVAEALQSLRDVQSRLNDPNLSDTDRQALEAKRTELTQAATKVNAVVTRSGSLLSTLAIHDNVWFADTLLPYLRESGASPPSASVSPQPNAQSEAFWLRHKLDAAAMSARKPDDLQRRLDQMIREASDQGAEGRALLVDFARRYSREHGSFYKLLTDAFSAQSHSFESTPGKNDPAIFRAMAHAFGVETSDAFEGVNLNAGAQPITLKEEVELVRLVSQAAEKIHSSFGVMNFTKITDVLRDLQSSATVTTILQKIESDPTKRAEILQKAVRAAFKESHGDIATRLTQRALEASWMSGESPDAIVLGFKNEHLVDLHIEGLTLAPQATFKSREDRLQAYYDSHPNVAQTRLAADKRVALYTGDTMGVLEAVLKLSAEDRLKALNDPLLTAELAAKHAELWPFIRHALEGQVPPQEMLSVLLALKQAVSLGLKPGEVMKAATESLPKGDVLGLGRKILTTMGKSVGGDVLQRAQQRMQPEMQKLVESWATWQGGRLEEQDPSLKGNKDERARRQQAEALNTLADPGFQALLRDHFSAEQRASITSVMMSGSTSSNDKAQQSRLGLGVDAKNVLGIIQKAYDDGKTAALREDPAVLAQLQKLGEAERQLALQLLFDTPAAKALSVMKVQGDLSDDNAVALLGKLATLSAQERDGIRNDPALVLLLTSKLKGDHLARFQRLMQLNGRSEAQATPAGQSEQDRERDWLRLRAVEGVKALITAKDDKALVTLAAALFKAKVTDPNAQAPGFAERAEQGARVGDLSAQDRPMMAEALRSSAEYAELLKRSPTLAAAVMDAVLGQRDPTPMLYHAEAARSWMNADVDGMVKAIEGVSADELLTQFVDLDAFAPALISALSAREALAALPADASDDQRQAAEQAVSAANQAMREATFDLSASRLAELSSLSKADQQKVLDAVRARVNKLLGGEAKDELALVARALQGAIGRIAPQSALKVDETLVGEVSNADRLARSQLAQAQTDMERSRKAVESVAALLPGLAVKLPGGLDLKQSVTEANQAIQAWADALAAASQSDAPLTEDQLKLLKTQQEAAEKAKKALTESFDKVVATATKHLNTAFETAMNAGEAALITTVTVATGGVATMPVGLLLSVVKPAVKKLVGLWIDRALRDEQHIRRADIAPAIVEVIKENVNEGWKKTLEASPIVGILAEGIAQIVAINLPFIDGGVEEAADKKISGQIEGQTNKLETFDDALVNQAGSLLNRENRRRGPAEAGGDVYGDSVSREQERAALRQGVRQRLEERAKQRGLRANDPVVTQTAAALQSTLGDGDVSRLQALVTEHGVEKMQGLLHNVVRPEDDAKLEDRISGPLRRFLQDLAAGGPGNQSPGAVGGLSAATPDNSADDGSQSAQNNTRSNATPDATSAPAPERMETLESSSGRSLRGGNVAGVSDRAAARLSSMSPEQAAEVQAILHDSGVSPSARALLERGLAAGYGLSELRLLRDLTVNRSDAELLAEFTGLGLSQIGQVSCLPTAYQIAIAEQDPLYAYRLRQNPDAMSTQDGGGGVVFTQAELEQLRTLRVQNAETSLASMPLELAKIVLPALQAKGIDPTSREALNEVDRILSSLGAPVQSGTQGLDVTQFTQNAALHKTLEARVGRELSLVPMNLQDVQAALAQGHPVPVLTAAESLMGDRRVADAHAQVILSFDGQRYTVHDPQGGGVRQLTAAELQRELGARWALLPTGAAVAPQATTSGGVTTPAPRGGDDRQRRLDAAQAVKTVLDDATVASIAAEVGEGDKGGDAPLNRLRAAIDARLATLRAQTQAAGEYASWLTTEFVLDLIAQDVALKRGLQKGLIGTDTNRAQVLESIKPAHRLAAKINAASDDRARLAAVAETVGRVGAEVKLLDGVAGAELLDALSKFERDEDRMVAQEMLQTGRVLSWLGSGANRALMIEDRGLDGVRAPLTERASLLTELGVLANSIDTKKPEDAKERLEGLRARVTQTLGRLR
ncbi:hypothetical protein L6R46_21420, partial [Myxococcota bacterium]|nr:hypothetical protein [Myxococcota bacterium]